MNYGLPWIRPTPAASTANPNGSPASATTLLPLDPAAYFGMASDLNAGQANYFTFSHTHRFDADREITTKVRKGHYERDQRASTVRLAAAASQPGGVGASLATFGPANVLTRGTQLKIQDMDNLYAQTDFSGKFRALGVEHQLLVGADYAFEQKAVYAALSAAQSGLVPTKPVITIGGPGTANWVDESSRSLRDANRYQSRGVGLYVQDLVTVAPHWKLLAGLRYDRLTGDYSAHAIPNNAVSPVTTTTYRMKVSELSKRLGVLFQPDDRQTYHLSLANSFNTSGDAYSLSASNVDTPPRAGDQR